MSTRDRPHRWTAWLSVVLATASILKLVEFGFAWGLGPTMGRLLYYYERLVHLLLGRVEVALREVLTLYDFHLYPHWKHIFVLMGLYFFRSAAHEVQVGFTGFALFKWLWGLAAATVASVMAGTLPFDQSDVLSNFLLAAIPVAGVLVYEVGECVWDAFFNREHFARVYRRPVQSWWQSFFGEIVESIVRAAIAIGLIVALLQLPLVQRFPVPGLAVLGLLVMLLALYALLRGALEVSLVRRDGEAWQDAYWRTGPARLGAAMITILFWTAAFVAGNAGLDVLGL